MGRAFSDTEAPTCRAASHGAGGERAGDLGSVRDYSPRRGWLFQNPMRAADTSRQAGQVPGEASRRRKVERVAPDLSPARLWLLSGLYFLIFSWMT